MNFPILCRLPMKSCSPIRSPLTFLRQSVGEIGKHPPAPSVRRRETREAHRASGGACRNHTAREEGEDQHRGARRREKRLHTTHRSDQQSCPRSGSANGEATGRNRRRLALAVYDRTGTIVEFCGQAIGQE